MVSDVTMVLFSDIVEVVIQLFSCVLDINIAKNQNVDTHAFPVYS